MMKKITLLFLFLLTASFGYSQTDSNYCSTEVTHLNNTDPAFAATAINLTIVNTGAATMKVTAAAANITFLALEGTITGLPIKSAADTSVPGEISITLTWAPAAPVDVTFQYIQWEMTGVPGRSQIENATTPSAGVCGPPPTPEEDASLSDLQLDDAQIAGFSSATTTYDIELADASSIPLVTLVSTTNTNATVGTITQASAIPGFATFDVTSEDNSNVETYTINFVILSPQTAAPTPPVRDAADVVSIYSDAYAAISPINYDAGWCNGNQPGAVTETTAGGDNVFAYNDKGCQGIVFPEDLQDVTGFTNIHVDLFIKAGTDLVGKIFNMKIVPVAGEVTDFNIDINGLNPKPIPGTWFSYDIPVTISGSTVDIKEFGITSNLNNAVWYDNLYFYKTPVNPSTDATLSDLTLGGTTVTGFDAGTLNYNIELPLGSTAVPTVVGTPAQAAPATAFTTAAGSLPGTSTVLVTAQDGNTTETYTVNFTVALPSQEITVKVDLSEQAPGGVNIAWWNGAGFDEYAATDEGGGVWSYTLTSDAPANLITGAQFNYKWKVYYTDGGDEIENMQSLPGGGGLEHDIAQDRPDNEPINTDYATYLDRAVMPDGTNWTAKTYYFNSFRQPGVSYTNLIVNAPSGDNMVMDYSENEFDQFHGPGTVDNGDGTYTAIVRSSIGFIYLWNNLTTSEQEDLSACGVNSKLFVDDKTYRIHNAGEGEIDNFNDCPAAASIKDYEIEGLMAYPNPSNSKWTISTKDQEIQAIDVFNVLGKRVLSLKPNTLSVNVDASGLAPGVYISTITTEKGTSSRKLIKN